jgi:hypothetical protein
MNEDNLKIYEGLKAEGRRGSFSRVARQLGTTRQNVRHALHNNSNNKIIEAAAKEWKRLVEIEISLNNKKNKAAEDEMEKLVEIEINLNNKKNETY